MTSVPRSAPTPPFPARGSPRSKARATPRTWRGRRRQRGSILEFAADAGDDSIEAPPPDVGQDKPDKPREKRRRGNAAGSGGAAGPSGGSGGSSGGVGAG